MEPMLCKLGDKEDLKLKGYIFEPKLDGTRAVCYFKDNKFRLINRRNKDITYRYPEFSTFKDLIKAKSCVLDGEIIVYDKQGNPNFNLLQTREQLGNKLLIELRSKEQPATYVVFDILEKDGKNLQGLGLMERKKILDEIIKESKTLQKIFFTENSEALWKEVEKRNLEGVVAKDKASEYYPGKRIDAWIKIKFLKTIDCIILGFTSEKRVISALVIGVYYKGKLITLGRVGTGFTESFLKDLHKQLHKIETKTPQVEYKGKKEITWVKPEFVCEVRYLKITKNKILRAPAFLRLRDDKAPKDCILEVQVEK